MNKFLKVTPTRTGRREETFEGCIVLSTALGKLKWAVMFPWHELVSKASMLFALPFHPLASLVDMALTHCAMAHMKLCNISNVQLEFTVQESGETASFSV